jgi:PRTRC genetic system protein C
MSKPRVFIYNGQEYEDPNPVLSKEQVRDLLARTFGALVNGEISEQDEGARTVIELKPRPQRKGVGRPVYTFGSQGKSVADLKAHMASTGAMVVDIRYTHHDNDPAWDKANLSKVLPNQQYVHLPSLGNVNYRTPNGSIQIADIGIGISLITLPMARGPVILLCSCPQPETCHRQVVADELVSRGLASIIVHLE